MVSGPDVIGYYEMLDNSSYIMDYSYLEYDDNDMDEYDYYDDESDDGMWYHEWGIEELEFRVYAVGI